MLWFKRIVFFFLLVVFLLLSGTVFITWKYEDDLKNYALETVRSSITTELKFDDDVVLSLWKDFPLIAIEISDIQIQDAFKKDTVLKVKKGFIQFDVLRLIRNDFQIEGIRVTDGFLRVRRTAGNQWNFRVWKTPEKQDPNAKTDFSIEILTLENIHLDYDDRAIDLNIQFLSEKSKIKGRFTDENTRLGLSLNGFMERLTTIGDDRIIELPLSLAGVLNINSKDKIYTIETGNAVLAGNEMVLSAEWKKVDAGTDMQMKVHAGNIEPIAILPHVWPQMPENIRKLNLEGHSDIILTLNGPFTLNSGPTLDATIRMRDGGLMFQNTHVSELNFEGKLFMQDLKRSKAMEIQFDKFNLKTPKGKVSGSGKLTDLNNPHLKLKTKGNSRLEELVVVANVKDEIDAKGGISWDIDFNGPLGKDFNTSVNELRSMNWSGSMSLTDAELKFNSGIPKLESFNANVAMNMGKTSITQCSGSIGHLEFEGEMNIAQLKRIMTEADFPIVLDGDIHIKELDIAKLPSEWTFESENPNSSSDRSVSITANTEFDRIIYNDFTASDVSGRINLKNNRVDVEQLRLKALGGTINAELAYFPNELGYMLDLDGELRNIDMSRTLAEWNNFGQQSIRSENLMGKASANLEADIQLNSDQQLLKDQLRVEANVEISGGELIEFEPLLAMSRFIDVDELNRVKFDTLRNQLSIRNNKLFIPRMSVSSSILNVDVFGEHGFDQEMDYHVNLLLNDLIRRKAKKQRTFDGHEIIDEKGKTRLFLWIRGRPGNLKLGFDKREVKQKIKADLKKEGQTIKQLFKDEFNGSEGSDEAKEENVQFRLEDDGLGNQPNETPAQQAKPTDTKEKKKKKRGLFSTEPDEQETEGGFEIEFEP